MSGMFERLTDVAFALSAMCGPAKVVVARKDWPRFLTWLRMSKEWVDWSPQEPSYGFNLAGIRFEPENVPPEPKPRPRVIYLASPYSHDDPVVREQRFHAVCKYIAQHISRGRVIFSPIAHSHPVAVLSGLESRPSEFWLEQCLAILARCDILRVLALDGWETSRGVQAEIAFARDHGIPVEYAHTGREIPF